MEEKEENIEKTAEELGFSERMEELQFLATGPFREINFELMGQQIFSDEVKKQVREKWEAHQKKVPAAFAGKVASIDHYETTEEGVVKIFYSDSAFDFYIGTKQNERRILEKPPYNKDRCIPVSMGAITTTLDGDIIVGIRGENVSVTQNKAQTLPAGFFDPKIQIVYTGNPRNKQSYPSLLVLLATELKEELGIEWFTESKILGIIQDTSKAQQPLIAIRLKLPFTNEEIRKRVEETGMQEIDKLVFIKDSISEIKNAKLNWSPHNVGKLILHFAL